MKCNDTLDCVYRTIITMMKKDELMVLIHFNASQNIYSYIRCIASSKQIQLIHKWFQYIIVAMEMNALAVQNTRHKCWLRNKVKFQYLSYTKHKYKSTNGTEVQGSICPPSLQVKFEDPTCRAVFSISLYGAPKSILFGTGLFVPLVQLFMIIVSLTALTLS